MTRVIVTPAILGVTAATTATRSSWILETVVVPSSVAARNSADALMAVAPSVAACPYARWRCPTARDPLSCRTLATAGRDVFLRTSARVPTLGSLPPFVPRLRPANASSCGSGSLTCFYDNCPSGSRTQAVCAGGNWTVETAACGTVTCDPDPSGSTSRTCSSGQICVVVNSGAFSYACMSNTCNISSVPQGPVSTQCTGMSTCSVHYSLMHGVTFICPTYICPPFCA
jgi:hypothetical protein